LLETTLEEPNGTKNVSLVDVKSEKKD